MTTKISQACLRMQGCVHMGFPSISKSQQVYCTVLQNSMASLPLKANTRRLLNANSGLKVFP